MRVALPLLSPFGVVSDDFPALHVGHIVLDPAARCCSTSHIAEHILREVALVALPSLVGGFPRGKHQQIGPTLRYHLQLIVCQGQLATASGYL